MSYLYLSDYDNPDNERKYNNKYFNPTYLEKNLAFLNKYVDFFNIHILRTEVLSKQDTSPTTYSNIGSLEVNDFLKLYRVYIVKKKKIKKWAISALLSNSRDWNNNNNKKLIYQVFMRNLEFDPGYYSLQDENVYNAEKSHKAFNSFQLEKLDSNSFMVKRRELRRFTIVLSVMNSIITLDIKFFQNQILEDHFFIKKIQHHFIFYLDILYPGFILEGFFNFTETSNNYKYKSVITLIEFYRMLCEDHNQLFQSFLLERKMSNTNRERLISFLLNIQIDIISMLEYYIPKRNILNNYLNETLDIYFYPLYHKISFFLCELNQGSLPYVYLTSLGTQVTEKKIFLYEVWLQSNIHLLLDFTTNSKIANYPDYLLSFLEITNCLIEENLSVNTRLMSFVYERYLNKLEKKLEKDKLKTEEERQAEKEEEEKIHGSYIYKFPDPESFHFILVIKKFNLNQIYEICKRCLEEAINVSTNDVVTAYNKASIFVDSYKYNSKFAHSNYVKVSFSIFKYIKNISLNKLNGDYSLGPFLENIQITAKSFITNYYLDPNDKYFIFLDKYMNYVEVVNLINDTNLDSIKPEAREFLGIDFKNLEYFKKIKINNSKVNFYLRKNERVLQREFFTIPPECFVLWNKKRLIKMVDEFDDTDKLSKIVAIVPQIVKLINKRYQYATNSNKVIAGYVNFNIKYEKRIFIYQSVITALLSLCVNINIFYNIQQPDIIIKDPNATNATSPQNKGDLTSYRNLFYIDNIIHMVILVLFLSNRLIFSGILRLSSFIVSLVFFNLFNLFTFS